MISVADYLRLRNSSVRRVQTRFWLFAPIVLEHVSVPATVSMSTVGPMPLVSPRYSLVRPGESVQLYGGDSYVRGGAPATNHTWTLVSGDAILIPQGAMCTVTPTGGEDSEVVVRLTVTGNGVTEYTVATIACSTEGWAKPTGTIQLDADFDDGWSGSMEIAGEDAEGLTPGSLLLVHIDVTYDGAPAVFGGYRRPQNLALVEVGERDGWTYRENAAGEMIATVPLVSPKTVLERVMLYCNAGELDGKPRPLVYEHAAIPGDERSPVYAPDFRLSDAAYYLLHASGACRHYNCTVFHDPNEYPPGLVLDMGSVWQQVSDAMRSILCLAHVNFAGSVMAIPSPAVRADEWWGTPGDVLPGPLDNEMVSAMTVQYRRAMTDYVKLNYIDSGAIPQTFVYPVPTMTVDDDLYWTTTAYEVEGTLACPNPSVAEEWAADLYEMHNRSWDVRVDLICPGNAFNLGDMLTVNLSARQGGQSAVSGRGWIRSVRHRLELDRDAQFTTIEITESTA